METLDRYYDPDYVRTYGATHQAGARFALTNHEPWDSRYREQCVRLTFGEYVGDRGAWVELWTDEAPWRDWTSALYLLDDGQTVRPFYVACYREPMEHGHPFPGEHPWHLVLVPMPTERTPEGSPVLASDGRPVDYRTWALGPRRAYHVKVSTLESLS